MAGIRKTLGKAVGKAVGSDSLVHKKPPVLIDEATEITGGDKEKARALIEDIDRETTPRPHINFFVRDSDYYKNRGIQIHLSDDEYRKRYDRGAIYSYKPPEEVRRRPNSLSMEDYRDMMLNEVDKSGGRLVYPNGNALFVEDYEFGQRLVEQKISDLQVSTYRNLHNLKGTDSNIRAKMFEEINASEDGSIDLGGYTASFRRGKNGDTESLVDSPKQTKLYGKVMTRDFSTVDTELRFNQLQQDSTTNMSNPDWNSADNAYQVDPAVYAVLEALRANRQKNPEFRWIGENKEAIYASLPEQLTRKYKEAAIYGIKTQGRGTKLKPLVASGVSFSDLFKYTPDGYNLHHNLAKNKSKNAAGLRNAKWDSLTGRDGYLRFIGRNEDGSVDMIDINVDDVVGNNPQATLNLDDLKAIKVDNRKPEDLLEAKKLMNRPSPEPIRLREAIDIIDSNKQSPSGKVESEDFQEVPAVEIDLLEFDGRIHKTLRVNVNRILDGTTNLNQHQMSQVLDEFIVFVKRRTDPKGFKERYGDIDLMTAEPREIGQLAERILPSSNPKYARSVELLRKLNEVNNKYAPKDNSVTLQGEVIRKPEIKGLK